MITIDEMSIILDEVAAELPDEIFKDLNGGVSLLDEAKRSIKDPNGRLYTLGEYRRDQMGRYIVLYYGSLCAVYGNSSRERYRKHLKDVLAHELTHHWESLAGERGLEIKDELDMDKYLGRHNFS
ncbi:MAG: metallopeptidase family protein [Oscillospiraceae bacterium]|nr:metallopeptidase family protein [Oscillospiraceae bacterium]